MLHVAQKETFPSYTMYVCVCVCVCVLVAQSCLTLCNPMDCSPQDSTVHGISQARILEWVAISFSRGSSQPRDWTWVSCIAAKFLTIWATKVMQPVLLVCGNRRFLPVYKSCSCAFLLDAFFFFNLKRPCAQACAYLFKIWEDSSRLWKENKENGSKSVCPLHWQIACLDDSVFLRSNNSWEWEESQQGVYIVIDSCNTLINSLNLSPSQVGLILSFGWGKKQKGSWITLWWSYITH